MGVGQSWPLYGARMCCKPGTVSVAPCGRARFCPFCLARPIFTEDPASAEDPAEEAVADLREALDVWFAEFGIPDELTITVRNVA